MIDRGTRNHKLRLTWPYYAFEHECCFIGITQVCFRLFTSSLRVSTGPPDNGCYRVRFFICLIITEVLSYLKKQVVTNRVKPVFSQIFILRRKLGKKNVHLPCEDKWSRSRLTVNRHINVVTEGCVLTIMKLNTVQ